MGTIVNQTDSSRDDPPEVTRPPVDTPRSSSTIHGPTYALPVSPSETLDDPRSDTLTPGDRTLPDVSLVCDDEPKRRQKYAYGTPFPKLPAVLFADSLQVVTN